MHSGSFVSNTKVGSLLERLLLVSQRCPGCSNLFPPTPGGGRGSLSDLTRQVTQQEAGTGTFPSNGVPKGDSSQMVFGVLLLVSRGVVGGLPDQDFVDAQAFDCKLRAKRRADTDRRGGLGVHPIGIACLTSDTERMPQPWIQGERFCTFPAKGTGQFV